MSRRQKIIGDSWYADSVICECTHLDTVLKARFPAWVQKLARRPGLVRAFLLYLLGCKYDLIVTAQRLKGAWLVVVLESLFGGGRRRVVYLEFMPRDIRKWWCRGLLRKMQMTCAKLVLRRGMRVAHVCTMWEKNNYASRYNLPEARFEYIPWPQRRETDSVPNFDRQGVPTVLCSGRAECDWTTFFKAAEGQNWKVTAVCDAWELASVKSLGEKIGATVLCNISQEEHNRYLESAAVYVISLHERFISCGQVRVMHAIRAGVPIVATNVVGLDGYLSNNETALLVDPGDPLAMREAVEHLLAHPDDRRRLAMRAFELAKDRTFERYKRDICCLVHRQLDSAVVGNEI